MKFKQSRQTLRKSSIGILRLPMRSCFRATGTKKPRFATLCVAPLRANYHRLLRLIGNIVGAIHESPVTDKSKFEYQIKKALKSGLCFLFLINQRLGMRKIEFNILCGVYGEVKCTLLLRSHSRFHRQGTIGLESALFLNFFRLLIEIIVSAK